MEDLFSYLWRLSQHIPLWRLDRSGKCIPMSKSALNCTIREGHVELNGTVVRDPWAPVTEVTSLILWPRDKKRKTTFF